jgi:hypothetical protein
MKFDTSTILGATALIVLIAVMLRNPDGTARIIRGLAEGYSTAVNAFPLQ